MSKRTELEQLLSKRILVLDGAMGTMIQRHKLTEDDFRGEWFKTHPKELRGNNDMLVLTRPDIILGIHEQYLEAAPTILGTQGAAIIANIGEELGMVINPGAAFGFEINPEGVANIKRDFKRADELPDGAPADPCAN